MVTSVNDARITAAINVAMDWMRGQAGKATGNSVWGIAYPEWVGSGYAWCGGFQVAGFRQAGVDLMRCAWWFYTPYIKSFAIKIGAWKTTGGEYGDQVLFDWQRDGVIDHVGASWPDPKSGSYRSVEGNTSPGNAGSQSNGGGCWVRYRSRGDIAGWVNIRRVLAWMIDNGLWDGHVNKTVVKSVTKPAKPAKLVADGSWGPKTTYALQYVNGTKCDSVVSSQPNTAKRSEFHFEWVSPKAAVGSALISAMQQSLAKRGVYKMRVDGLAGPGFAQALCDRYKRKTVREAVAAMQVALNVQLGY